MDNNTAFDKSAKYLKQNTGEFFICLNDNELHLFKNSRYIKEKLCFDDRFGCLFFAVQYHDKDEDKVENRAITPHYHVVMTLTHKCSFKTMQDIIMEIFHCNANQIGLEKATSVCACTRYLCHLDHVDKYPYRVEDVVTNNREQLDNYFKKVRVTSIEDLIGVVKHYNYSLEEIMMNIGDYDKWRKYINDLINNYYRNLRYR